MYESLALEQYTPFPREITIDIDSWKNIIENSPAHHAVCCMYKNKMNSDTSTLNEEGLHMPKRVTRRSIIWKIKYICHRVGTYKSLVYRQKMNHPKAGQSRNQARRSIADAMLLSSAIS
ncbi:unnamed protein product [Rhizopus microsporus]